MAKILNIKIGEKQFPINFSLKATKEITVKFGGWDKLSEKFRENPSEAVDMLLWLLALLINEGLKYRHIVDGEPLDSISEEELETILSIQEIKNLQDILISSMAPDREVETLAGKSGNAETTQDK